MSRGIVIAIVVVAIVGAVYFVGPSLAEQYARTKALTRCAELEAQLAALRVQGGDVVKAKQLENELAACNETAKQLGAAIDLGAVTLTQCESYHEQIAQEWAHYRSTDYSDGVKRNNTRNTILRLGEESARCFAQAIAETEQVSTAKRVEQAILKAIGASEERARCFKNDMSGCGRFGLNEPHGNDKARDERQRISEPLRALLPSIAQKVAAIRGANSNSIAARGLRTINTNLLRT